MGHFGNVTANTVAAKGRVWTQLSHTPLNHPCNYSARLRDAAAKVCNEKKFQRSGAYISVGIHFTENLKVPAERL